METRHLVRVDKVTPGVRVFIIGSFTLSLYSSGGWVKSLSAAIPLCILFLRVLGIHIEMEGDGRTSTVFSPQEVEMQLARDPDYPKVALNEVAGEALHGAVCGSENGWKPLAAGGEEYAGLPETEKEARKDLPGLRAGGCGAFLGAPAAPRPSHSSIRFARTIRLWSLVAILLVCVSGTGAFSSDIDLAVSTNIEVLTLQGGVLGDEFDYSVSAAGDVNGDGFADVIVGARTADPNGRVDAGAPINFGNASGFVTLDLLGFTSSDSTGYIIQGAVAYDYLGWSVSAAGDNNAHNNVNLCVDLHRGGAGAKFFHRDVKSANICLTATLSAKLIDCGLAMMIEEDDERAGRSRVTGTGGGVIGTPQYVSPEYSRTGKCSEKAEVFSFDIVVLEVLTGRLQIADGIDLYAHYRGANSLRLDELDERCGKALELVPELAEGLCVLARACLMHYKDERIGLPEVLWQLNALVVRHCTPTVEEGLLSAACEEMERLKLAFWLHQLAVAPAAVEEEEEKPCVDCVVCMDPFPLRVRADREALRVRTHIIEEIMTLKCPSCRKAFIDFEACFALSCTDDHGNGCGSFICGFCLTLCRYSEDAHQHVAQCPFNINEGRDVWGPIENFEEAQRLRRLRLLREYLGPMAADQRDRALHECEGQLRLVSRGGV
ncbi:hypothetical protein B484DRAFT_403122 [Ochromonadaceae sp. CCMP2298]|nr:hypothetical protein B484DRAFT_403122 [Ochromonadaceae sp. CCMP2298]